MLDPRGMFVGRSEVDMQFHDEVRRHDDATPPRRLGHLQKRRDATDARRIMHDHVHRPALDKGTGFGRAAEHLASADRGDELSGQGGVTFQIVGIQRLLDPGQVELLQRLSHARRGGAVPLLVDVDHQRHLVTEVPAQRLDPPQVGAPVRLADLQLDPADTARAGGLGLFDDLLDRRLQVAAGGVVAGHRVAMGPKQLGQRQAGAACLEVPERGVEGGNALHCQAAAPDRGAGPAQPAPQAGDVVGILAQQQRRQFPRVGILRRAAGAQAVAEAQPLMTLLRLQFDEQ